MAVTEPESRTERASPPGAGPRPRVALGAFAIAFSGIFVRLSHASPATAAAYRCGLALPLLHLLARREERRFGPRSFSERVPALLAGLFFAGDLIQWNAAIGDVGAGLATVLANIQVLIVPLVAWALLGERVRRAQLAALPFAALGVLLISGALDHSSYGAHPERGALLGVGAGIAYVGFILLLRHGSDERRIAGPLRDATLTALAGSLLAGVGLDDLHLAPTWPSVGWLLVLALSSQVVGWMLIAGSLPRLPAAISSMLLVIQPVAAVLFAALILGESPSALQLGGVGLVILGLLTVRGEPEPGAGRSPEPQSRSA